MALAALPVVATAQRPPPQTPDSREMLSAASFGTRGDGVADDSTALQAALDAAFAPDGPGFLAIPPGTYKVTKPLRVVTPEGQKGDIGRRHGVIAHGARLVSAIADGGNVFEFVSRATVRFLLIEGLDILGGGREGHGISLECEYKEHYLYNLCLRDVTVQGCGGDGCHMMGNVFEGQVINAYLRDNKKNGMTLGHGARGYFVRHPRVRLRVRPERPVWRRDGQWLLRRGLPWLLLPAERKARPGRPERLHPAVQLWIREQPRIGTQLRQGWIRHLSAKLRDTDRLHRLFHV
jgi:hypothetical protein